MAEQDLKWYGVFAVLFGIILSFADPITDILTLVEFYREDHKTWFGVGLAFVVLPCLVFPVVYYMSKETELKEFSRARRCIQVFLCGFNPFSPALARLQTLIFYVKNLKKLWRGDKIQFANPGTANEEEVATIRTHNKLAPLFEAILESTPQFILQLYVIAVQQESVKIIQVISLPVSFLSLALASTVADELIHSNKLQTTIDIAVTKAKHKILLFVTHLFLLSSRLLAIVFFAVCYNWWTILVLAIHSVVILTADIIWICRRGICETGTVVFSAYFCCLHWLRDDLSIRMQDIEIKGKMKELKRMQLLSNGLFVVENIAMILPCYFSQFSDNLYAIPVTVCVCSFAVLGATMRVTHFHFLIKGKTSERLPKHFDLATVLLPIVRYF